jgi:hypothetical protein
MLSLFLNSLLALWGNGLESQKGEVWFYHPLDGTFKYQNCKVKGDWKLETQTLQINDVSVRCDQGPGWLFEQSLKNITLDRDAEVLNRNGHPVGVLLPGKNGFDIDLTDDWDDEHHLKVVARTDGSWRLEWFVQSSEYVSFDLLVSED